jgi:hypothetical protein
MGPGFESQRDHLKSGKFFRFFYAFYRMGPRFISGGGHKINLQGADNKSGGTSIASRKGAGSP